MSPADPRPLPSVSRRGVLAGACGAAAAWPVGRAYAAVQPGSVAFQVWRNGRQIGEHMVRLSGAPGEWTAEIDARFVVYVGPIPVLRYRHTATELWRGGRFASLQARSVTDGLVETVRAARTTTGVSIQSGSHEPIEASADTAPFTHWNMKTLSGPFFNPQTGKMMDRDRVQPLGERPVLLANGHTLQARAFALTGEDQMTDWYDAQDTWTGLHARVAMDGSLVDYRRVA